MRSIGCISVVIFQKCEQFFCRGSLDVYYNRNLIYRCWSHHYLLKKIILSSRNLCHIFTEKNIYFYSSSRQIIATLISIPSPTGQRTLASASTQSILAQLDTFWYQFFSIAHFYNRYYIIICGRLNMHIPYIIGINLIMNTIYRYIYNRYSYRDMVFMLRYNMHISRYIYHVRVSQWIH